MRLSTRNRLKGKVVEVKKRQPMAHVRLDVSGTIVTAADELGLKIGRDACAAVKASDVMIAIGG
jgi:molybdopterin-binding protein